MAEQKTVVLERIFDAPVERVWAAWSEPEQLMKWWGPEHFTSPEARMDFRVGGKYVFCMQAPDGQKLYSCGVYKEIVPMQKIVATDSFSDADGNVVSPLVYGMPEDFPRELTVTITFEELPDGKTKMKLIHEGLFAGDMADQTQAGWSTSFDKLANSLKS